MIWIIRYDFNGSPGKRGSGEGGVKKGCTWGEPEVRR